MDRDTTTDLSSGWGDSVRSINQQSNHQRQNLNKFRQHHRPRHYNGRNEPAPSIYEPDPHDHSTPPGLPHFHHRPRYYNRRNEPATSIYEPDPHNHSTPPDLPYSHHHPHPHHNHHPHAHHHPHHHSYPHPRSHPHSHHHSHHHSHPQTSSFPILHRSRVHQTTSSSISAQAPQTTSSNGFGSGVVTLELKTIDNPLTPEIAIDCEMVEARGTNRRLSVLARVSVVNSNCEPLLDTYVNPMHSVTDYRTPYSGIRPEHLKDAPTYVDVRECVVNLVSGRTLIGHDLKQDLAVLGIENLPNVKLRDTSRCYMSYFRPNEKPSLKRLAAAVLGQTIQIGAHDSMEDAKAAMRLYKEWIPLGRNEEEAVPVGTGRKSKKHNNYNNINNNNYNI